MRIASEKANAGPSLRDEEMKTLEAILIPKGLVIHDIAADGHCMFRAIEDQMKYMNIKTSQLQIRQVLEVSATCKSSSAANGRKDTGCSEETLSYLDLRKLVAAQLRSNYDKYVPFLDVSEDDGDQHENCSTLFDRYQQYCNSIEKTAKWGGHLELHAIADATSCKIEVYSADMQLISFGPEESREPPILLCYLKHAYGLGEHYNSIRKMK